MVKSLVVGVLLSLCSLSVSAAQWQGIIDWSQRTELSTAVSGVVSQVLVEPGERVKKGQLLLALEQRELKARLTQRKAEMKHQSLLRDEASKELERAKELYARTLLADHDLDLAKVAYAQADAAYKQSLADVREAEQALAHSQLKAPFNALVIARQVHPAQTVVSQCQAMPLLTLAAAGRMRVKFAVKADELSSIAIGTKATVEQAGKRYPATVKSIGFEPKAENGQKGYPVEVEFAVKFPLRAGLVATVSVP